MLLFFSPSLLSGTPVTHRLKDLTMCYVSFTTLFYSFDFLPFLCFTLHSSDLFFNSLTPGFYCSHIFYIFSLYLNLVYCILNYKEFILYVLGFPGAQLVKNVPTVQETLVRSSGQEDPME